MRRPRGDNQAKILAYIKQEIQAKGYPPSVREICTAVGLKSTSTVHGHLTRLEKKGLLHRDTMKPRAIEILGDPAFDRHAVLPIPVLGRVAAGTPITATQEIGEHMLLPVDLLGDGNDHFLLTVQGSSMINIGIYDGDFVVVRQQSVADNGEIVVAMVDDEATVKRFYREGGHFRLQPENDTMPPIIVDTVTILGKVVALLRKL
ncbi:MAG: transcriptional repressor LexA [Oscillospiraceae bacterium]|nr:transcriptional repressor LexA [Oscillospiraceae bacterium]